MNKDTKARVQTPSRIKLALHRVSLRTLSNDELSRVAAGTSISIDTHYIPTGCRGIIIRPDQP